MAVANTLALSDRATITAVKSFMVQVHGVAALYYEGAKDVLCHFVNLPSRQMTSKKMLMTLPSLSYNLRVN